MIKYFDVYKSTKGYYVKEDVCRDFGINSNETRNIKDVLYYKVPEETISSIEETTKNEAIQYVRNVLALFDLQIILTLKILVDKTNNKKYINKINADKLNVVGNKKTIDNILYVEITDNKIQEIVESSKNDTVSYNIVYEEVELELENERKPVKNLFLYYHDLSTDTLYITREILELVKELNIDIETTPKIIDNRNCYSITPDKLKEFETKSGDFRGVEKLLRLNDKPEDLSEIFDEEDIVMPYNDGISTVVDEDLMPYDDSISKIVDEIDPVIPYDDTLSTIFDETSIANRIKHEVNKALKDFFQRKEFVFEKIMPYDDNISTVVDEDLIPYDDNISTVVDEDLIPYDDNISTVVDEDLMPYDNSISKIVDEDLIPYDDKVSTIIDNKELEAIKQNIKNEFEKYLKKKIEEEEIVIPYDDDISTIYDETVLVNRINYELKKALKGSFRNEVNKKFKIAQIKNNIDTIMVYRNITNGKLFIPEEYAKTKENLETIMNKRCYETTINELETIYNKRFLIIGVATRPKKEINIVICNNDGDLFISNEILKQFNIVSHYSKAILVNKEIYTQIGNEELDQLEKVDLDNAIVSIEIKKIVKINK